MSLFARRRFNRELARLATAHAATPALAAYAAAAWPGEDCPAREAPLLALDFELDGLRRGAHLLQAGWTAFTATTITLAEAVSCDIRSDATLDRQAVTIHGIGEQRASRGEPLGPVIERLVRVLAGRIVVAHAAAIERTALADAVRGVFGAALPIRTICTLRLEQHIHPGLAESEAYRLGPARSRYGLPDYAAHDALTDAIAAGELFQAQLTRLPAGVTLGALEAI
ncbi:MAG: exonuclease domain-containing protein [Erythrobacter sp.]|uniref:exonuclease domain-containing protein n=1 Tax=Erythrobacter sp. TaxID=1042 RepID=UPI0032EFC585